MNHHEIFLRRLLTLAKLVGAAGEAKKDLMGHDLRGRWSRAVMLLAERSPCVRTQDTGSTPDISQVDAPRDNAPWTSSSSTVMLVKEVRHCPVHPQVSLVPCLICPFSYVGISSS